MSTAIMTHLNHSNLPPRDKSTIRHWYDRAMSHGGSHAMNRAKGHALETGHAIRQGAESVVTGAILGAVHVYAKNGLDLNGGKIPLDALVGVAGMVGGVMMAHEPVAQDLRNAGAAGLTVYAFRESFKMIAEKHQKDGKAVGGTFLPKQAEATPTVAGEGLYSPTYNSSWGADPILEAARRL